MNKMLFDDEGSDNEVTFKSNSEYAKKYNTLRRKEEWLKLKNKYGDQAALPEESSSSEDDDDDDETLLTEEFEKDFFKTLAYLKNKDPRIYDKNVRFFNENVGDKSASVQVKKNSKEKPMTIRDYNRKIILEKEGKISDEEEDESMANDERPASPTHVQELQQIKAMFSSHINDNDGDSSKIATLFTKKKLTKEEEEEEERNQRQWLAGQVKHLKNAVEEKDLKSLKEFWSNPSLDEEEAFLRDYFLNQSFKVNSNKDRIPTYDEIVNDSDENISEDEKIVGQQAEFEHKFNFRFEEPDQDFIKRYPRTLEHSMRQKDNKRAMKRAEVKERKADEKKRKKEEIAQLKSLKLKEIQEKIKKLKEITGNDQLAFKDEDIEGEFDPDAHDRRMRELFDEEYYGEDVDAKKPVFPDIDEELEIDNWDEWGGNNAQFNHNNEEIADLHCEDENFNMDCDYDPSNAHKNTLLDELPDTTDGRRKRKKRKNQLAEALARKKPVFDPATTDKTFAEYLDEYYKLDCEDVIGDMPCRFKYREVPSLDYGLTTAEILMADDQELNRWYPLKKTLQYRPEHKQKNDHKVLADKARNVQLKMKILPSLFKPQEETEENPEASNDEQNNVAKKKKKKKKNKNKEQTDTNKKYNNAVEEDTSIENKKSPSISKNKKATKHSKQTHNNCEVTDLNNENTDNKKSNKHKNENRNDYQNENSFNEDNSVTKRKKKEKYSKNLEESHTEQLLVCKGDQEMSMDKKSRKRKRSGNFENNGTLNDESFNKSSDRNRTHESAVEAEEGSPKKKNKKNNMGENQGNFKKHFDKNKHKKSNKNQAANINENNKADPINNLTDERLKAYGLNPKKYRSFMKFKKY